MAKRGLRKGSKCVRRHRSGRCAEFSSPRGKAGKARKGGKPKKRKSNSVQPRSLLPKGLLFVPSSSKLEKFERPRVRGKFAWSEGKWTPLAGRQPRRKR